MYVKLYREPELHNPTMIAGWSGVAGVGVIAVDTLRLATLAEKFAEIAPRTVAVPLMPQPLGPGILKYAEFPTNSFYFHKMPQGDLLFFAGQAPPRNSLRLYESGKLVLDIAQRFQCKKVYVAGATITKVHHTSAHKVHAMTNNAELIDEMSKYPNTLLMSEQEANSSQKRELHGLHGVILEESRRRGIDSICLLGETPSYISLFPHTPYPKASRAIVQVLTTTFGIDLDIAQFDDLIIPMEENITRWVEKLPADLRAEIDELKQASLTGVITEEDKQNIMEEIDRFFKASP